MADITRWVNFWNSIFHRNKALREEVQEQLTLVDKYTGRGKTIPGPPPTNPAVASLKNGLPVGYTFKYGMEVGYPYMYLYKNGKKIADTMVFGDKTEEAADKLRKVAKFIEDNDVDV